LEKSIKRFNKNDALPWPSIGINTKSSAKNSELRPSQSAHTIKLVPRTLFEGFKKAKKVTKVEAKPLEGIQCSTERKEGST
jgi:hypothetical protein